MNLIKYTLYVANSLHICIVRGNVHFVALDASGKTKERKIRSVISSGMLCGAG